MLVLNVITAFAPEKTKRRSFTFSFAQEGGTAIHKRIVRRRHTHEIAVIWIPDAIVGLFKGGRVEDPKLILHRRDGEATGIAD